MPFRIAIGVILISGCAGVSRNADKPQPLRIEASHYQSMTGVAITSGAGPMTCNRDMITGSHVLRWYCRPKGEPTQFQLAGPIVLVLR